MASSASMHKNKKSTLARIKRFLAKGDDHFSTSSNQIIMKCHNSLYSRIYSAVQLVQCSVHKIDSPHETQEIIKKKSESFQLVKVGDEFGPTWSSHLFKLEFQMPDNWIGKHIHLRWNSSSEAMLLDDAGIVLQGFIPKHRESFVLSKSWPQNGCNSLTFYVEMSCNGLFGALGEGFSIDPPISNLKYRLKIADIAIYEPLIFQLYTDLELLLGIAEELSEDIRGFQALYTANQMINCIIVSEHEKAREIASKYFGERAGAKAHTLVAMGHCHIDTAWLWTYDETKRKCARSWASQIALMKEYPNIVFTCSQMQQFAWMKEEYPILFESIKEYVKLKRFIPVGGTWVEMDGLLPDGESFIRQFFYGQRFLREEFGVQAKEFWLPDTFGYSGQIPQIMKHVGLNRFLTQKLSWNRVNKFPHHSFWWEGIDGTRVLTHFPPGDSYEMNGWVKEVIKSVNNSEDKGRTNIGAYLYGLGDGGGGPTVSIVERLNRLQNVDGLPKIVFDGPDKFFTMLESDAHKLCRWVGELYLEMHNGTYTSQAKLKWYNRKLEMLLKTAELKSALAKIAGQSNNTKSEMELIDECWKGVLLNQFHDVIPGSCIEKVVVDALAIYKKIFAKITQLNTEKATSLGLKSFDVDDANSSEMNPFVGFNPLPWPIRRVFSIPISKNPNQALQNSGLFQHISFDGFPSDKEYTTKNYPPWTFGNPSNFVACLAELSPSGYSRVTPTKPLENAVRFSKSDDGSTGIFSNGLIRLEFSLKGSNPKEKLFKIYSNGQSQSEWEVFSKDKKTEAGMFYLYDDNPVCWDAWDCDDYYLETKQSLLNPEKPGTIEVVAEGPIMAIYKWKFTTATKMADSPPFGITRYTIMKADSPLLEYISIVDWEGQNHKFLKVEFPINVYTREATYEIQYGHIKRPTHSNTSWEMAQIETSGQKWVDLSQHGRGVSLLNDSKYGFRIKDNIIQLSLLRAPKAPDGNCDMHQHVIKYAILPHDGSFQQAGTIRQAYEFNAHFEFYRMPETSFNFAALPSQIITTSHESIIPEVIKLAQDCPDNTLCIRLYESFGGSPSNVKIILGFQVKGVIECDGLENQLHPFTQYPVSHVESSVTGENRMHYSHFIASFRPFQIRSFLISI